MDEGFECINKYFYEVYENIPRQGPGTAEATIKAFMIAQKHLPKNPGIIDIGCGKGVPTLELSKITDGKIVAVDNHPAFVDFLNKEIYRLGLENRLAAFNASMFELPFEKATFDLVWSEGAIFIMGIKEGIDTFKYFLRPGGLIVFSDMVFLKEDTPSHIFDYLKNEYPQIMDISEVVEVLSNQGFEVIDHFTLSSAGWIENYYKPLAQALKIFKAINGHIEEAAQTYQLLENEIAIIEKQLEYIGYEFFIAKNIG